MATARNLRQSLLGRLVNGPEGFRELLQRLGPTFIKIGQFLALRPDLLPQEYCDELLHLLDQVPSFPWEEARAILTAELGKDPMDVFAFVEPTPVAAGSLAQVHLARLKDGTEVAVKVQRPRIREMVLHDLRRARLLARLLALSGASLVASPSEVVEELTEWMMQEIDFHHELENLSRLYRLADGSRFQRIPRPYPNLSSSKVITSEYLRGVPVSELLLALRSKQSEAIEHIEASGIDRDQLAANLLNACLRQIFRYQFFHADPHPGNLIVLPGNVVGFVDFGLCDELDETVRAKQMRYLFAVYTGDADRMFRSLMEILIPAEETNIEAFRRDFFIATSAWREGRRTDGQPTQGENRSSEGHYLIEVMRTARRHKLQIPRRILSMYRALLTVESVANQLRSDLALKSVGLEFFKMLQMEESLRLLELDNIQPNLISLFTLLRDSPSQLQQILSELSDGRFATNVTIHETSNVVRAGNRRARLLAMSILSVGLALLLTIPDLPEPFGVNLAWPLSLLLILNYAWIFVQWRRLR